MKYDKNNYPEYVKQKAPASPILKDVLRAFVIGGVICTVGQVFKGLYEGRGIGTEMAGTATSITMVFLGVFLTALGLYDKIAKYAGAGTLVPITGFANSVAAPAMEFKPEGFILGVGVKMFTIAGPVIVYGTAAAFVYGLILWLAQMF